MKRFRLLLCFMGAVRFLLALLIGFGIPRIPQPPNRPVRASGGDRERPRAYRVWPVAATSEMSIGWRA